jgi:HK97 family phage prohead protease
MPNKKEERHILSNAEFRASEKDGKMIIEGYASVFDSPADMGWYTEYVRSSAFTKTIKESDIRALFNHDPNYVLGRNKSGTLDLSVDKQGLFFRTNYPDIEWARGLAEQIKRGDISQCSFAFRTIKDNWTTEKVKNTDGLEVERDVRELLEVKLYDVSPVTYPAYESTTVSARGLFEAEGINIDILSLALFRKSKGQEISKEHREMIKKSIEIFSKYSAEEPPSGHSTSDKPINITCLRQRLELAEKEI